MDRVRQLRATRRIALTVPPRITPWGQIVPAAASRPDSDVPPVVNATIVLACRDRGQPDVGLTVNARQTAAALRSHGLDADWISAPSWADLPDRLGPGVRTLIVQAVWYSAEDVAALERLRPELTIWPRIHSQLAFLAIETAVETLRRLPRLTFNHRRIGQVWSELYPTQPVAVLPNLVDFSLAQAGHLDSWDSRDCLVLASLGANRIGKHHGTAAAAALLVAKRLGKRLRFLVNSGREEGGRPHLVRALFAGLDWAELIEVPWQRHADHLRIVAGCDLCFQLSASETFNYVSADATLCGVPSVVGQAIDWAPDGCLAPIDDPNGAAEIAIKVLRDRPRYASLWKDALEQHQAEAVRAWVAFLPSLSVAQSRGGPGTELRRLIEGAERVRSWLVPLAPNLLAGLRLTEGTGCKCRERAALMDGWGVIGCRQRIDLIVDWLSESISERGWPVSRSILKGLVRLAIRRAERCPSS
jgi:hypothetical protein